MSPADGASLQDRGILYCPDFLINAGGIIDVYHQRTASTEAAKQAHIHTIEATLLQVLERADTSHRHTNQIAEQLAMDMLRQGAANGASKESTLAA